jgi:hypothetical protein
MSSVGTTFGVLKVFFNQMQQAGGHLLAAKGHFETTVTGLEIEFTGEDFSRPVSFSWPRARHSSSHHNNVMVRS